MAKAEIIHNILPVPHHFNNYIINDSNLEISFDYDLNINLNSDSVLSSGYDYFSNILKQRKQNNNRKNLMKKFFFKN